MLFEEGSSDHLSAGLPGYCGLVERKNLMGFSIELWPQFRIGGSLWPSGALLARFLCEEQELIKAAVSSVRPRTNQKGLAVLELGAGVGLPSFVAARDLGARNVVLTDVADLVGLLQKNIQLNFGEITSNVDPGVKITSGDGDEDVAMALPQRRVAAHTLDWAVCEGWVRRDAAPTPLAPISVREDVGAAISGVPAWALEDFDLVMGTDIVYAEEQEPLIDAIDFFFQNDTTKFFLLGYRERSVADREYLEERILPRFGVQYGFVYGAGGKQELVCQNLERGDGVGLFRKNRMLWSSSDSTEKEKISSVIEEDAGVDDHDEQMGREMGSCEIYLLSGYRGAN